MPSVILGLCGLKLVYWLKRVDWFVYDVCVGVFRGLVPYSYGQIKEAGRLILGSKFVTALPVLVLGVASVLLSFP